MSDDAASNDTPGNARRDFLKTAAVAGLAAATPAFPAFAQNKTENPPKPGSQVALAETIANYAAGLKYEDIPEEAVRLAKRTILDTIGCMYGGYTAGPIRIAIKLAGDVSAKRPATVLLSGRLPMESLPEKAYQFPAGLRCDRRKAAPMTAGSASR